MDNLFDYLTDHKPSSANADLYPEVTYKSAGLLIPQLKRLAHRSSNHRIKFRPVAEFHSEESAALLDILEKNGSDKGNRHHYYYVYFWILRHLGLQANLRVFEIGLGTNNPSLISTMGKMGTPGASLRAFRDFLPNASIFGADIDKDILFTEERIDTAYVDQLDHESFDQLPFANKPFDLIIDDGLHSVGANINTLLFAMSNVKHGGWIVIEDIPRQHVPAWEAVDLIIQTGGEFETCMVRCRKSRLYVLHRKAESLI